MKSVLFALIILLSISITNQATAASEALLDQAKIDSLLAELPKAKGDTNEVQLLRNISFTYTYVNPDLGIKYGNMGLKLGKKNKWKQGVANSYYSLAANYIAKSDNPKALEYLRKTLKIKEELGDKYGVARNLGTMGLVYLKQSDYPKALEYFGKALKINKEIGDRIGIVTNLGYMANVYRNQSNYPKSLEYYNKALKSNEESGDKIGISSNLGNMGIVYYKQSDFPKALEYYNKALKIKEEIGDRYGIATNLNNIGNVYHNKSDYSKALEYYNKALKIKEEVGDINGIANNLTNIAGVYKYQSEYPKALEYYNKALKIKKEIGNKNGISIIYGNIGETYLKHYLDSVRISPNEINKYVSLEKGINLNNAIEYSLQAIKIGEEIGELDYRSKSLKTLSNAYKLKGNMEKAYYALEMHHKLKDSIFNQENSEKIAALEKAREDDLKQKEIEKQKIRIAEQEKREQLILYFAIGIVVLMTVVMIVIYRLLKRSDKLLYNVLPVSIAKRLKKKEHPISDYFTQASIVFIDIVNFTELAKDEDPRRVVEALNKIFTMYDAIANKYGLEKIKTIGDSYMAAAGIPEVQKDNTHRAAQMALEVKAMMRDYRTADGTKIEVRIGLDCGPVVAGVIGENKFIYDMWSDAVNTASRMESSSIAGQVHVSERFKEAVTEYEQFEYVERGEIDIKGKGKMKTYFIEERKTEVV
jgi:class 3 adenylate cyclase/Tfp pilus assembly protein PilF